MVERKLYLAWRRRVAVTLSAAELEELMDNKSMQHRVTKAACEQAGILTKEDGFELAKGHDDMRLGWLEFVAKLRHTVVR